MSATSMAAAGLVEEFLRHLAVERGLSKNTCLGYGYQLRGYTAFLAGRGRDSLSAVREDVTAYLAARREAGLSDSTVFAAAVAVRQFHRFLAARGRAAVDPTAGFKLPKYRQRLPEPFGVADMERLLAAPAGGKYRDVRNHAMLELLYATGVRVSELTGLTLGRVNLAAGWVRVLGKGNKERVLPMSPRAKEALLRYLAARQARFPGGGDPVFLSVRGRGLSRTAFWQSLKRMARRAGITRSVSPHVLRHTTASVLLEGGADIRVLQEMLGHASVLTTQRYTHVSPALVLATCRRAHPGYRDLKS